MADETFVPAIQGSIPEPFLADEAEAIAKIYRRLVLLVGGQLLLGFLVQMMGAMAGMVSKSANTFFCIVGLFGLMAVAASVFIAITAYKLAGRLRAGPPILWAVAMFLPCISIITLLVLSAKAQSWCRLHGVKVGFFGPTKESIEELRQRSTTSVFE